MDITVSFLARTGQLCNKATLFRFIGTRASYEPFSQSQGVSKIKNKIKIVILWVESPLHAL